MFAVNRIRTSLFAGWLVLSSVAGLSADELGDALQALKSVGPNAAGHAAAQAAWKTAAAVEPARLPLLLAALDDASPLAANWIRAAVDAVGERALKSGDNTVGPILEKFTLETNHAPRARRLAFDWLARFDASATDRLVPGFADDPSVELRRDAIDRLLAEAGRAADDEAKRTIYRRAFAAARDIDQIADLAEKLKKLGVEVDLPTHYGFVTKWQIIGPFDNVGLKGFNVAYPPESEIRLDAKYPGKGGAEVAWKEYVSKDAHGKVDFNEGLGKHKGAAAYAYAEFVSEKPRSVDVRIGSIVAVKVWVNGKQIDSREAYHSGTQIDQYVSQATLQPGVNRILVKACENEQTESWAQDFQFQLRICDPVGTAILSQDRIATK